jgi:3,4-dihydroxy 2-butanone 4-phosphate synthase / GTP cyclohydrolase II
VSAASISRSTPPAEPPDQAAAWPIARARVERARSALAAGGCVVVLDREGPDGSGMVVMAAARASRASLQDLRRVATGDMYLALSDERCEALGLELIPARDDDLLVAPVTMRIAARDGVSVGVSLAEHARTIAVAIDPASGSADIRLGGHVQPLRARPGGILERAGYSEAAVELAGLAGIAPAGVIGEIRDDAGGAPVGLEVEAHASRHRLPVVTIGDLIAYRRRHERLVERVVTAALPTAHGVFTAVGYRAVLDGHEHLALVKGDVARTDETLVYVHLACWAGDVFGSRSCNCRARLDAALAAIETAGRGVVVHLAREHPDTHRRRHRDDELRDYGIGAQILADLGVTAIRVLTDHPRPLPGLEGYGIEITSHRPFAPDPSRRLRYTNADDR